MPYSLDQPVIQQWPTYAFHKDVFTPEECKKIVEMFGAEVKPAGVGTESGSVDVSIRRSDTTWIKWSPETDWIFDRLARSAQQVNSQFWNLSLSAYLEDLQLTRYQAQNKDHYGWHQDMGPGTFSKRKLSQVVLLSDLKSFEGGKLEMFNIRQEDKAIPELNQGTVITFPSFEPHRVTPVIEGERWSLVSWVSGPPLK